MIVLDENVHARSIRETISQWYPGPVISVTNLRPKTIIKDEAIPSLLIQANEATFVTINVSDFWRSVEAHPSYCIVLMAIEQTEVMDKLAILLKVLLSRREFATKAARLGKVILISADKLEYYGRDKQIYSMKF